MNRKKAWLITLIVFFAGVSLAIVQNKVAPCILTIIEFFDINMATAGWLSSIFSVVAMATALPAALILARLGAKKCGIIALLCAVLGSFIGIFAGSIESLMVSRIIEGIGVGLISVVAPALISMWFPAEKRGLPMGVWGAWQMVAQSLTFFVGDSLTNRFGWQGLWYFGIAFLLLALVLFIWKVVSPPADQNYADVENTNYSFKEGLKSASSWFMGLSALFFCFACFGFVNWVAPYWSQAFGWDIGKANQYVSMIYFLEIGLVILVGFILDHTKHRKRIGLIAYALYACILFYCFRMNNPALIIPFCIIYPLLEGAIPTVFWTVIPQTVPKSALAGVAIGILGLTQNLGMVLGPPVTGYMIETFGWSLGSLPMVAAALLGLLFLALVKIYPPDIKKDTHQKDEKQMTLSN